MFYSLCRGIKNIVKWFPLIWRDRDWDWDYLAVMMEFKLRNMSTYFKESNIIVDSQKVSRETLICAELLKRLREDDIEPPYSIHEMKVRGWKEMLNKYLIKKMRTWWD